MKLKFHEFRLGDVDDPEIYAAEPIWQWQQTDKGRWVMDHAQNLTYNVTTDPVHYGYLVYITGHLEESPTLTEYLLKWHERDVK